MLGSAQAYEYKSVKKLKGQAILKKKETPKKEEPKELHWYNSFMMVDQTQRFISNQWVGLNYNMDSFFSNESYKKGENKSLILAYYGFLKKEGQPMQYNSDIRIKVHLPQTTGHMRLVIEKERDEILQTSGGDSNNSNSTTSSSNASGTLGRSKYVAGISYLLFKSPYFQTFMDTGMRLLLPLDPFMKLRLQKPIETSWVNIFLSQSFILYRQDGFQEISQLSFFRKINAKYQMELINTLNWTDQTDIFIHRNNLVLYQQLDGKQNLTYSIGANAKLSPTFYYDKYDASINYRKLIHKNWLFVYLSVGADFFKENDFNMENFVQTRLEVFFR